MSGETEGPGWCWCHAAWGLPVRADGTDELCGQCRVSRVVPGGPECHAAHLAETQASADTREEPAVSDDPVVMARVLDLRRILHGPGEAHGEIVSEDDVLDSWRRIRSSAALAHYVAVPAADLAAMGWGAGPAHEAAAARIRALVDAWHRDHPPLTLAQQALVWEDAALSVKDPQSAAVSALLGVMTAVLSFGDSLSRAADVLSPDEPVVMDQRADRLTGIASREQVFFAAWALGRDHMRRSLPPMTVASLVWAVGLPPGDDAVLAAAAHAVYERAYETAT